MITTRPIISYLLYTQIYVVIQRFTTFEDVCWNIRNVKIKPFFFPEMRLYFLMFITAVWGRFYKTFLYLMFSVQFNYPLAELLKMTTGSLY